MTNVEIEAKRLIVKAKATVSDLVQKSKKSLSSNIHTSHFDQLVGKYAEKVHATVEDRVGKDLVDLSDEIQISKSLNVLEGSLEAIAYFLTTCINNHQRVPREIYYALDWFLARCPSGSVENVRYIVTVDPELAMVEFQEILVGYNFESLYSELFDELKDLRFYFIFLPPGFCKTDSSLMWPLIFHEMGHVIDHHFCKARAIHPALPRSTSKLVQLARRNQMKAIEKLWAQEYTSDYLAVLIAGPALAWLFLRYYSRISTILESSLTHPATKTRMGNVSSLLRTQGFSLYADKTEEEVTKKSASGQETLSASFLAMADMQAVFRFYEGECRKFADGDLRSFLASCGRTSEELVTELLDFRPVVAPPSILYTITAFEERMIEAKQAQELLADCLRQHSVLEEFKIIVGA